MKKYYSHFLILALLTASCQTSKPYYGSENPKEEVLVALPNELPLYTLYLIGDAGLPQITPLEPSLALLQRKLEASDGNKTAVVFLGDNIYEDGLHKEGHPERKAEERKINAQLDILEDFSGRIVFLPGNHDWHHWGEEGYKFVQRQERYVESYLNKGNIFLPDGACPGPAVVVLNEQLVWIILDTQWWLHDYKKPRGKEDSCQVASREEFLLQLEEVLQEHKEKQIIISAHHPLYSNGTHGGYFPLKDHIFPLTHLKEWLYIPLPVIGSIYPMYRKIIGHGQDIPNPEYQEMVDALTARFSAYKNIVYTAGHDHTLQYQKEENIHHIISGSGSKEDYLRKDNTIEFGQSAKGFGRLYFYQDGSLWLQFLVPDPEKQEGRITFSRKLR